MRKYIFLFLLLCFTTNVLGQNTESSQTEQHQLVEWSKTVSRSFSMQYHYRILSFMNLLNGS